MTTTTYEILNPPPAGTYISFGYFSGLPGPECNVCTINQDFYNAFSSASFDAAGVYGYGSTTYNCTPSDCLEFTSCGGASVPGGSCQGFFYMPNIPPGVTAFASITTDQYSSIGVGLDLVPVPQVPLPSTLPLFAIGLAGLALLRRRKHKSSARQA